MRRLFAYIGFSYLLAQTAAVAFGWLVSFWLCGACLAAVPILLLFRKRTFVLPFVVVLLSGAVAFGGYALAASRDAAALESIADQRLNVSGKLVDLPYTQNHRTYYVLQVESASDTDGTEVDLSGLGNLRISSQQALPLELGGTITGQVQLYRPSEEDGFSSTAYYRARGVSLFGYFTDRGAIQAAPPTGTAPAALLLQLRHAMAERFQTALSAQEAGLLSAAVLGERENLDGAIKENFTTSGIYHILVVSGLHVSLIASVLLRLLLRTPLRRRVCILITMAVLLCFMAMTGFAPGVLRSGIMNLIMLLGMLFFRRADALNSLGLAALLICLWNPFAAGDLGLLLSVASTMGILVLTPFLERLGQNWMELWGIRKKRLFLRLWQSFCITAGATLFTMPLLILTGRPISLIAPLTNLLLLFPSTWMIQLGAAAAVLLSIPGISFFGRPLLFFAGILAKCLIWMANIFSKIPFASVPTNYGFVVLWLVCSMLLLAYLLLFFRKKQGVAVGAIVSVLILFSGIFSVQIHSKDLLRVAVLDVGDGISVVLSKNHTAAILGCEGYRSTDLMQYLQRTGIHRISYLQLISGSAEERENAADVLLHYPTEQLLLPSTLFLSGNLQKSLAKDTEVTYHQNKTNVITLDDVLIELDGDMEKQGVFFTANDMRFLIAGEHYAPIGQQERRRNGDFLITDGFPRNPVPDTYLTTILSMDAASLPKLSDHTELEYAAVNLYATAGNGLLELELHPNRTITLRRD